MGVARDTVPRLGAVPVVRTIALLLCAVASVAAGERDEAQTERDRLADRGRERPSVDRPIRLFTLGQADLTQRAGVQLESLAALQRTLEPGLELGDLPLAAQLSGAVRSSLERTTRDVLEDALLDSTSLEYHFDRLTGQFRRDDTPQAAGPSGATRRGVDVDFSLRGIVPGLKLRAEAGRGEIKLRLDARGRIGLGYYDRGLGSAGIWVGFDGGDRFDVSARFGF
jgi:hypothetical protein